MFSLNNFLNESLQSAQLYKEILNEPGGLFRYFQVSPTKKTVYVDNNSSYTYGNNHNLIGDITNVLKEIQNICKAVFKTSELPLSEWYKPEENMAINKIKLYNKKYNELVSKYLKLMSHIFDKPNPRVFGEFVSKGQQVDLFNITDDHFKKMTYNDCRVDKQAFTDICNSGRFTVFWFNGETKQLLAISREGYILQFGTQRINTKDFNKRREFPAHPALLNNMCKQEYLVDKIRTDTLSDGTEVVWPHLANYNYGNKQYGFNFINNNGLILPYANAKSRNLYVIGNPFVNTSPIRNKAGWDKNGYVIIYMPEEFMKDKDDQFKGIGAYGANIDYNTWKAQSGESKQQRRRDYASTSLGRKYKWNRDDEGNIIPYTIDGDKYIFDFGPDGKPEKIAVSSNADYADVFNNRIRQKNVEHYRYLVKQHSSNKEVILFSKSIKDFSTKTLKYLEKIEIIEDNYMNLSEDDMNKADLIQEHINNILYNISRMKRTLEDFENYMKIKDTDDTITETGSTKRIQRYMDRLTSYSSDLNDSYNMIDKLLKTMDFKNNE